MELLDPRLALVSLGVAAVTSEKVRRSVGRGLGYVAAGTMAVGGSMVNAGRDIVVEAKDVAGRNEKAADNGKARSSTAKRKPPVAA